MGVKRLGCGCTPFKTTTSYFFLTHRKNVIVCFCEILAFLFSKFGRYLKNTSWHVFLSLNNTNKNGRHLGCQNGCQHGCQFNYNTM